MKIWKTKKNVSQELNRLVILPILCLGFVVLVLSITIMYRSITHETEDGLRNLAYQLRENCMLMGNGDFSVQDEVLLKGGIPVGEGNEIVDRIERVSGIDATIFYGDVRILTTVRNTKEKRAIGTRADSSVVETVLKGGNEFFSTHVPVNGQRYYGYYIPLYNEDDSIVGMVFVGKARSAVMKTLIGTGALIVVLVILVGSVTLLLALGYAKSLTAALRQVKEFLRGVAHGNVESAMEPEVLERQDEVGEMGRFALMLQEELTEMTSTDPLTGLYNRRCFENVLFNAVETYKKSGSPFTFVIGDIDDFKLINDTYGHVAGDTVLIELAGVFKKHMERNGFAARWGGEEFVFLYEDMGKETAITHLAKLMDSIREKEIYYEGTLIQVRMTFGVTDCREEENMDAVIRRADERLYQGKTEGKDRII